MTTSLWEHLDWSEIRRELDQEGYALLPKLVKPLCADLLRTFKSIPENGKTSLSALGMGSGEMLSFDGIYLSVLESWREKLYQHLAPVANGWNEKLEVSYRYPSEWSEFVERFQTEGQTKSLDHGVFLGSGDGLSLHQHNAGAHVFPLQLVALLSAPGRDFTGGEFVMTEQRPRMQSRPMVLPLQQGDLAIVCTSQRPFQGSKGFYRVNIRHAVSRIRDGQRWGLELFFHRAAP